VQNKLDNSIKLQFKNKLKKCSENPHIAANKLTGFDCAYKIKLRSTGYRLVYEVDDTEIIVFVIAVGKRENNQVYDKASHRKRSCSSKDLAIKFPVSNSGTV
jgi:mRNA interferase RelE/StbE